MMPVADQPVVDEPWRPESEPTEEGQATSLTVLFDR